MNAPVLKWLTSRRPRWATAGAGITMALLAGGATASLQQAAPTRIAIERPASAPVAGHADHSALSCNGGAEYPVHIELVPDAVINNGGRERVEYHAEIKINRGKDVGLAWEA